jgi:hypothetical protein
MKEVCHSPELSLLFRRRNPMLRVLAYQVAFPVIQSWEVAEEGLEMSWGRYTICKNSNFGCSSVDHLLACARHWVWSPALKTRQNKTKTKKGPITDLLSSLLEQLNNRSVAEKHIFVFLPTTRRDVQVLHVVFRRGVMARLELHFRQ